MYVLFVLFSFIIHCCTGLDSDWSEGGDSFSRSSHAGFCESAHFIMRGNFPVRTSDGRSLQFQCFVTDCNKKLYFEVFWHFFALFSVEYQNISNISGHKGWWSKYMRSRSTYNSDGSNSDFLLPSHQGVKTQTRAAAELKTPGCFWNTKET